ncbi:MAG: phosphate-binding protein [Rhizobiales bacterium]|nr:phosphate-binding protein [Hyphomicrobiales bacterium]
MKRLRIFLGALTACGPATAGFAVDLDGRYAAYDPVPGIEGTLKSEGSDTLANLMALWSEGYLSKYPKVRMEIAGTESADAPPALIRGKAQFGPMARAMTSAERDSFEEKFGYKPTQLRVALETLAVFVNKENPLTCLSFGQIDEIFSRSHLRGGKNAASWGDLGVKGEWATQPITAYGPPSRDSASSYFREVTMLDGDIKDSVKTQPNPWKLVQAIAADKYAIGYTRIGYRGKGVKALQLDAGDGKCVDATQANAYSGAYPVSRFLYLYVDRAPGKPLDPLRGEFLRYVLSSEGQADTSKDGFFPMPFIFAREELGKIGG